MVDHFLLHAVLSSLNYTLDIAALTHSTASLQPPSHKLAFKRLVLRVLAARFPDFGLDGGWLGYRRGAYSSFSRRPIHFLGLVFGAKAGSSHCIDAPSVQWMLCTKVRLSKLLALRVELNGSVKASKFLMLLSNAQVRHNFDRNEITELEVETLSPRVRTINPF